MSSKLKIEFHLKPSPFLIFVFLENWIFRLSHFFESFSETTRIRLLLLSSSSSSSSSLLLSHWFDRNQWKWKMKTFFFCSRIINMNENVYRNHNNYYYHYHHHHEINIGMKFNSMIVWASDQCTHPKLESISYR